MRPSDSYKVLAIKGRRANFEQEIDKPGLAPGAGCLIIVSSVACSRAATSDNTPTSINGTAAPTNQVQPVPKAADTSLHITADERLAFVDERKLTFRTGGIVAEIKC